MRMHCDLSCDSYTYIPLLLQMCTLHMCPVMKVELRCLAAGIEQSHSKLINMYQFRPHRFQVVHVTPPVHYNTRSSVSLAGKHDHM